MRKLNHIFYFLFCLSVFSISFSYSASAAAPAPYTDVYNGERGISFNDNWKFSLSNPTNAQSVSFNDASWRSLTIPHDWSIELAFRQSSPSAKSGGFLDGGTGWYRKTFTLPSNYSGKRVTIHFEGVYMNSEVYINGTLLGTRPYGYSSFEYDLTPYLKAGSTPNVIAVKVDAKQPNSRWYSGSGIYRDVWITATDPVHVAYCGVKVKTPTVSDVAATVNVSATVENHSFATKSVQVVTSFYDKDLKLIHTNVSTPVSISANSNKVVSYDYTLANPQLWSCSNPYLYKVKTQVMENGIALDTYSTNFGVRTIEVGGSFGFKLNGVQTKLHGVCMHHDLGSLGAAQNYRALERQVEILKSFGVNSIRTSHNPPAPALLEICDRMGMLVMDEAFDMWVQVKEGKTYAYAGSTFTTWGQRDLQDMVRRDQNHPCVIMWSIGNEIPEQSNSAGYAIAQNLITWLKAVDDTRPITDGIDGTNQNNLAPLLDVVGYNYRSGDEYDNHHDAYPNRVILGTETSSAVRTRGVYHLPTSTNILTHSDMQCSSYDNSVVNWGQSAENSWEQDQTRNYVAGQYIWTGFDYIGEPTPYDWPAKSSYFGIVDMCGFPKDIYYFYQSQWTTQPMVHLLPHWNWSTGNNIPVWAYSNCDEVQLEVNGVLKSKQTVTGNKPYHLEWNVPFAAGKIRAFGYKGGKVVAKDSIVTAGTAAKIELKADRKTILADGKDLSFIETNILDKNGTLVPDAANQVTYTVSGPGRIVGVDNGNPISIESFKGNVRKAFNGKCLAIVQSTGQPGQITVTATAAGLSSSVTLQNIALGKTASADSENATILENIAVGKSSSATSEEQSPSNPAYYGNDGDTSTRWCADNGNTGHSWQVDLGISVEIKGTEVLWEKNLAYGYKIETSTNNTTWTMAVDKTSNTTASNLTKDLFNTTARYIRITITAFPTTGVWASFYEFKVLQEKTAASADQKTAAKAIDDNTNTYWEAADGNTNHYLTVDLGKNFNVNKTEVVWQNPGTAYKYKVETSTDNATWSVAANKSTNTNTAQTLTDDFTAVAARYVRISVTGGVSTTNKAAIAEFRIFDGSTSTGSATPLNTAIINAVTPNCVKCDVDKAITHPWINLNSGGWEQKNETTIHAGDNISLSTLTDDTIPWQWTGPDGFTATGTVVNLNNVTHANAGQYTATYADQSIVFNLKSVAVGLEDANHNRVSIYPNPSKDGRFNVSNCAGKTIIVNNMDGKNVYKTKIASDKQVLDLSRLPKGVFIVKITSDKETDYRKIIIGE